jgi:hypothetical protein
MNFKSEIDMTTFTTEDRKLGADPFVIADLLEFHIDPAYLDPSEGSILIQAAYLLRMQQDEIKALRNQLIVAVNQLMEIKR